MPSSNRMINTKFWSDAYIAGLLPLERYLFLYFLTNERTNICGIYEIPKKYIAVESGLNTATLNRILKRFDEDKKVFYEDGWIYIVNFVKNQNLKSDDTIKGIERSRELVPEEIMAKFQDKLKEGTPPPDPHTALPTPPHIPNLTKPNLTKRSLEGVLEFWNQHTTAKPVGVSRAPNQPALEKLLPECRKITPEIERAFGKLKAYAQEDFERAIRNYVKDILNRNPKSVSTDGRIYAEHRFSFYKFLKQENGFIRFNNE